MNHISVKFYLIFFSTTLFVFCYGVRFASEQERVANWHQHNTWPPKWQHESPGYRALMEFREQEVMSLPAADERWENWMVFVQTRMLPKFTSQGFAVAQTPSHIAKLLHDAVAEGIRNWDSLPSEAHDGLILNRHGLSPKWLDLNGLDQTAHLELLSLHEVWIGGIKLIPTIAYGVRLYQNGTALMMHCDKVRTHVISSIIHIAHEYDNENVPWPLHIEDHEGRLHSVNLEAGQQLFYESAKCLHGRRGEFKGKYYGSLFVHYQPADPLYWNYTLEDVLNNIPPHWSKGIIEIAGSRWRGPGMTINSRLATGTPPRVTGKENPRYQPPTPTPTPSTTQQNHPKVTLVDKEL